MPPSHHSSSSHSSHSSHSSRSYSSSRSSSSRSSSSRSSGGWSSSRGPSGHSSSSHSSRPASGFSQPGRAAGPTPRPRVNQPSGYKPFGKGAPQPRYYYGRRHDYIYYPIAWVDTATGNRYEKGYYDESGKRYEDVSFQKNGNYENVLCHCPYCEQDTLINLSAKDVESRSLQCPNCGGAMEIRSALDDTVQNAANAEDQRTYTDQPARTRKRGLGSIFTILFVLILLTRLIGSVGSHTNSGGRNDFVDYNRRSTLYLVRTGDNSYRVTDSGGSADKTMKWDSYQESFYDPETETWIWYNTEMEEPVWQYWVEGISSDYGDYGWMEHDLDGWWIEAGYDDWIELPAKYDVSRLWYID